MADQVLALDIGGTKIAAALVAADGAVMAQAVRPTPRTLDAETGFAAVGDAVRAVLARRPSTIRSAGVSTAGPLDTPSGDVSPVNIPAWRRFPLVARVRDLLRTHLDVPVRVTLAGDGHCFALGEHRWGAGRGETSLVGLVLSTGVGGGAVIDGRLYAGGTGNAVHLGHISVQAWGPRCVCGGHGCVELYARGPALVAAAQARGWRGGNDARALTDDARAGDAVAREVIDAGMRALAAGIAATATELDVRTFVVGGGVARAGEVIFAPLRRHLRDFATLAYVRDLEVRPAVLPNAGLLGAAALAFSADWD